MFTIVNLTLIGFNLTLQLDQQAEWFSGFGNANKSKLVKGKCSSETKNF
jgi:hypothetical protein